MGAVYDEFQRDLARLHDACAGDARREALQLFLLALEREELVSVGYRESLMDQRLAAMPLSADVREVIHHALVWIWKDEEMHTIYIRGALLQLGGPWLRFKAFATQLAGGIGGWASSVLQHSPWRRAPFSRMLASAITWIGRFVGKVPTDVARHLRYGSFRAFCDFNVDTERTAAHCWYRITELAAATAALDAALCRDFRRVAEDEDRHAQLFQILHDALTDDDALADGVTLDSLVAQIRTVGEEFLPRQYRARSAVENPLASGGTVFVREGQSRSEKRAVFARLLVESDLAGAIARRAALLQRPVDTLTIAIKPTFMLGYGHHDPSPLTDVGLMHDLLAYLGQLGCRQLAVIEGRSLYDRFYQHRDVRDVAEYFGYVHEQADVERQTPAYRISDASLEQVDHQFHRGLAQYSIARTWRDADFRISFAKMRSHPIEGALLTVGNVEWVGARCDEYLFLERQADRTTAIMMLLDEFPPHFALLDGYENAPDGLVGVMGCRRPKHPLRLYAGADALSLDVVALRHLGVRQSPRGSIVRTATHWLGGMPDSIPVDGVDTPIHDWQGPYSNELRSLLSFLAYPVYVTGSGRGRLFVPTMDETAFPPLAREGVLLRCARRVVRWFLDLNVPRTRSPQA